MGTSATAGALNGAPIMTGRASLSTRDTLSASRIAKTTNWHFATKGVPTADVHVYEPAHVQLRAASQEVAARSSHGYTVGNVRCPSPNGPIPFVDMSPKKHC